jgi:hypothetical protein
MLFTELRKSFAEYGFTKSLHNLEKNSEKYAAMQFEVIKYSKIQSDIDYRIDVLIGFFNNKANYLYNIRATFSLTKSLSIKTRRLSPATIVPIEHEPLTTIKSKRKK